MGGREFKDLTQRCTEKALRSTEEGLSVCKVENFAYLFLQVILRNTRRSKGCT
jgi:hypothetical protein